MQAGQSHLGEGEKWDHCIENSIRKVTLGAMVGSAFHLFFFRMWLCTWLKRSSFNLGNPKFVRFLYGLPIGFGLGQSWTEAKLLFGHDVKFDRCLIATVCLLSLSLRLVIFLPTFVLGSCFWCWFCFGIFMFYVDVSFGPNKILNIFSFENGLFVLPKIYQWFFFCTPNPTLHFMMTRLCRGGSETVDHDG